MSKKYKFSLTAYSHTYIGYLGPDGFIEYENVFYPCFITFCEKMVGKERITQQIKCRTIFYNDVDEKNVNYGFLLSFLSSKGQKRNIEMYNILDKLFSRTDVHINEIQPLLKPFTEYLDDNIKKLTLNEKTILSSKLMEINDKLQNVDE